MPLTYADLLPVTARGHREPGDNRVATQLDLCWLSPTPEPTWSTSGRRTRAADTPPAAARRAEWRDRWRVFNAELDLEIRLAALTSGDDIGTGVQLRIAPNHALPGDSPVGSRSLTAA